ncbi:dihydroxy-acid dehydratase [Primorskyibacter sp. 2E107]|uniref:dihydroxy-acid dehydratase n=1 Tax=Primorskyibacter sp. 2E107 TaxID=3403458 RepID=UPI003AF79836
MAGRRRALAAAGAMLLALAGCEAGGLGGGSAPAPLTRAVLADGTVTVSGPEGYCIDPRTLSRGAARNFALIASCQALSEGASGFWVEPVLVTVTVGRAGAGSDLPSAEGFAQTEGARLLASGTTGGLLTANLDRGGEDRLDGGDPRHWRGAFVLNGRLVMLALYAPQGSEYAAARGGRMLSQVKDQITALSAARTDPVVPQAPAAAATQPPKKPGGLFGRLFNPKDLP